jgi:hypothetical protein
VLEESKTKPVFDRTPFNSSPNPNDNVIIRFFFFNFDFDFWFLIFDFDFYINKKKKKMKWWVEWIKKKRDLAEDNTNEKFLRVVQGEIITLEVNFGSNWKNWQVWEIY